MARDIGSKCLLLFLTNALLALNLYGCDSSGGRNANIFMALEPSPTRTPSVLGSQGWQDYEHRVCAVGEAVRDGYQVTVEGKRGKASISPARTALNWLANNIQVCTEWDSFQYPPTRSTCKKFALFDDTIAFGSEAYFFHDICMKDLKTSDTWVSTTSSDSIRFVKSGGQCVVSVSGDAVSDMFSDPEYGFKSTLVSCASMSSGSSARMDEFSAFPLACVKYGMCDAG